VSCAFIRVIVARGWPVLGAEIQTGIGRTESAGRELFAFGRVSQHDVSVLFAVRTAGPSLTAFGHQCFQITFVEYFVSPVCPLFLRNPCLFLLRRTRLSGRKSFNLSLFALCFIPVVRL